MSKVNSHNETRTHRSSERGAGERTGDTGHHASHGTVGGHESHQHVDQGEHAHRGHHAEAAEDAGDASDVGGADKSPVIQYKFKEGYATGDAKDTGKTDTGDKTGWQKGHDLAASGADEGEHGGDQSQAWKQIPTTDLVKKLMQAPPKDLQELGKKLYENLAAGKEGAKALFNPHEDDSKTSASLAKGNDASAAQGAKDAKFQAKFTTLGGEDQDPTVKSLKSATGAATADPVEKSKASSGSDGGLTLAERQEAYRMKAKKAAGELGDQMFSDALDNLGKSQKNQKGQKPSAGGSKGASGAAGAGSGGQSAAGAGGAEGSGGTGGAGGGGGGGGGGGMSSTSSDGGGGLDGLSGMELVQAVMLSAAAEASKSAQDLAKQVQSNTAQKNALRAQMAPIRDSLAQANSSSMTPEQKAQNANMSDLQDKMDAIGDDNQILFIKLQNATQQYSSMLQACSNVSKTLFDIDKAVIGNIGH